MERSFDAVLVHGDPAFVELPASFPAARGIAGKLHYTGLVGPVLDPRAAQRLPVGEVFEVVVSVGGGAVGAELLDIAVAARSLSSLREARWLVLAGPNGAAAPRSAGIAGLEVRGFVPDLPARLSRARLSISQAGYNTVADLAAARCPAVLVPFARGGETEQTRRADLLAERGWAVAVPEAGLTPERLAAAVDRAAVLPEPGPRLKLDGARRSADILATLLGPPHLR